MQFQSAALAWLVLDEALSVLQILGGGLILIGIFIARPKIEPGTATDYAAPSQG
jgi:hypothetical protein